MDTYILTKLQQQSDLFEVGGKGKNKRQIAHMPNNFLAMDDLESGNGQHIPLWLFGFMYWEIFVNLLIC